MNKRIKELEKQSVFYNEDEEIWETDLEKFAELIVRECAQVSKEYAYKGICSNHYDEIGIDCLPSDMEYYVLNYFGVEE